LLFFAFLDIHIQIQYHLSTFFSVLPSGPPTVVSGPSSAKFSPLPHTSSYATGGRHNLYVKLHVHDHIHFLSKAAGSATLVLYCKHCRSDESDLHDVANYI